MLVRLPEALGDESADHCKKSFSSTGLVAGWFGSRLSSIGQAGRPPTRRDSHIS